LKRLTQEAAISDTPNFNPLLIRYCNQTAISIKRDINPLYIPGKWAGDVRIGIDVPEGEACVITASDEMMVISSNYQRCDVGSMCARRGEQRLTTGEV